jgi:hypothetical protein
MKYKNSPIQYKFIFIIAFILLLTAMYSFVNSKEPKNTEENFMEFELGPYDAEPNQEFIICKDITLENDVKITSFIPKFTEGTHHILLDIRSEAVDGIIENCPIDSHDIFFGAGTNGDILYLPANFSLNLKKGTILRFQFHYKDRDETKRTAYARLKMGITDKNYHELNYAHYGEVGLFEIPPGYSSKITEIPINENIKIIILKSHMHENSIFTLYEITPEGEEIIFTHSDWKGNPAKFLMPDGFILQKGDKLKVKCEYENPTNQTIHFPEIMCLVGYYYIPLEEAVENGIKINFIDSPYTPEIFKKLAEKGVPDRFRNTNDITASIEYNVTHYHEGNDLSLKNLENYPKLKAEVMESYDAVEKYKNISKALEDHYFQSTIKVPGMGEHFTNLENHNDGIVKITDPDGLVYDYKNHYWKLVGIIYTKALNSTAEDFSGEFEQWHKHSNLCFTDGLIPASDLSEEECEEMGYLYTGGNFYMTHLWLNNTDNIFGFYRT